MLDIINPATWLNDWIFGIMKDLVENDLDLMIEFFERNVQGVQGVVSETPTEFSSMLVDTLRNVSDTVLLPIAGLIITYLFCYELWNWVTEKNRGGEYDVGSLMFLIIRTACMILLVTHSFDITLAFFDLGQWITNQVPESALQIPQQLKIDLLASVEDGEIGKLFLLSVLSLVGVIVAFAMTAVIHLVAWSRIVMIALYISVAPLAFATFLNRGWVGTIGQNYIKNLMALALQGFFMMICLVVYGALLDKVGNMIVNEGSSIYALLLLLVSMGVLMTMLTRTHSTAKSVMGAA